MTSTLSNYALKDDIQAYWAGRAATFDTQVGHEIFTREERAAWLDLFRRHLDPRPGQKALDLACGTGVISLLLHELGYDVTGLDMTDAMLEQARRKIGARKLPIRLFMGDAEDTREPNNSYDVVVTRHLVWTLPDPAAAFADWLRVLKPGGKVLIVDGDFVTTTARGKILKMIGRLVKRFEAPGKPHTIDREAHERILRQVHFAHGCRPEEVQTLLAAAGFTAPRIDRRLGPIHRAQRAMLPLSQYLDRIGQDRFALSATKPKG